MKKTTNLVALVLLSLVLITTSCKKDKEDAYSCASCASAPEALAENDNSSKGIYKGFVLGSSGTIKFSILNGGSLITAEMILDGEVINLQSSVTWQAGQAYFAPFTGVHNGQVVSVDFSVGASGSTPTVTSINIPGHPNAVIEVIKETSDNQIKCFEGTFSGDDSGGLNVILSEQLGYWTGVAHNSVSGTNTPFNGTLSGNNINCNCQSGTSVNATLSGDEITSGTWNDGSGTGTWSAVRTL